MPDSIAKWDGIAVADIAKFNGISVLDVSQLNGIAWPSGAPPAEYVEIAANAVVGSPTITASGTLVDGAKGFDLVDSDYAVVQVDGECWIQIDFGSSKSIYAIRFRGGADTSGSHVHVLETSPDAITWTPVVTWVRDATNWYYILSGWYIVDRDDVRYIRLNKTLGNWLRWIYTGVNLGRPSITMSTTLAAATCKLLIDFDGVDDATTHTATTGQTVTFIGGAHLDTAQKKWGSSSLLVPGSASGVTVPDSDDWYFGTGEFRIDGQFMFNTLKNCSLIAQWRDGVGNAWLLIYYTYNKTLQFLGGGSNKSVPWCPVTGRMYHVTVGRAGNTLYFFADGFLLGSSDITGNDYISVAVDLEIGSVNNHGGAECFDGLIDEVVILKGVPPPTTDFVPPSEAYSIE
jgi:hypothetical protein